MWEGAPLPFLRNFAGCYMNEDMTADYGDEYGALSEFIREHTATPRLLVLMLQELDELFSWGLLPADIEQRLEEIGIRMPLHTEELVPYLQDLQRATARALVDGPAGT